MKKIIQDAYKSTCKRGLITDKTTIEEFIDKLYEEVNEVESVCKYAFEVHEYADIEAINKYDLAHELSDVIKVCMNFATHFGIDIKQSLIENNELNYERADKK